MDRTNTFLTIRYVNQQLFAFYSEGLRLMSELGSGRTDTHETGKVLVQCHNYCLDSPGCLGYALAWNQFQYTIKPGPLESIPSFAATFDTPRLEFICSHDVCLRLGILAGHLSLDTSHSPKSDAKYERLDYKINCSCDFFVATLSNYRHLRSFVASDFSRPQFGVVIQGSALVNNSST